MTFVKIFGILLGLLCAAYGLFAAIGGVNGPGPCRVSCGFNIALLGILGQPIYGVVYGTLWMISGLAFIWFIVYRVGRKKRR